jgi:alpha-mannosidase
MHPNYMIISHTHWDREWYLPFEQFRLKLVDLVDRLLELLDRDPRFRFHLDAQTIVLEDYLAIRPGRRDMLAAHIRAGRIFVGPWYVQNDFFLVSGEATVRNLLAGIRIAESFGRCSRTGYAPDQFGLISQLPQIFNGFGIRDCVFGRGYAFFKPRPDRSGLDLEPRPAELTWRSPDGSSVLGINLASWYNNAQRFSSDPAKARKLVDKIERDLGPRCLTSLRLLMNGVDHLEAQEDLSAVIDGLTVSFGDEATVTQASLEEYTVALEQALAQLPPGSLPVAIGELRQGSEYDILQGTLSSRIALKAANVKAQNRLESMLEPLWCMVLLAGGERRYPKDTMDHLWKLLMQNHPHDSICGCSRDEVHAHMADRFASLEEAAAELEERAMSWLSARLDRGSMQDGEYHILVANTLPGARNALVEAELYFPADVPVEGFSILDPAGLPVAFAVLDTGRKNYRTISPINLPGNIQSAWFRVGFVATALPGFGWRTYRVVPGSGSQADGTIIRTPRDPIAGADLAVRTGSPGEVISNTIANEFLQLTVDQNGSMDLSGPGAGGGMKDFLWFEDEGDRGDAYCFLPGKDGLVISSRGAPVSIVPPTAPVPAGVQELQVRWELRVPRCYLRNQEKRCPEDASLDVVARFRLVKGEPFLRVHLEMDNQAEDHRLRLLLRTGVISDISVASAPFDMVERSAGDAARRKADGIRGADEPTEGLIRVQDESSGLAVYTTGIHEFEHTRDGILASTILRSTGVIIHDTEEGYGLADIWKAPANQCSGRTELDLAIRPCGSDQPGDAILLEELKAFRTPVMVRFGAADPARLEGGRFAVQESDIREIFRRPLRETGPGLPAEASCLAIEAEGMVFSALKLAEDHSGLVVRAWNPGKGKGHLGVSSALVPNLRFRQLRLDESLPATPGEGRLDTAGFSSRPVSAGPRKICTLGLAWDGMEALAD